MSSINLFFGVYARTELLHRITTSQNPVLLRIFMQCMCQKQYDKMTRPHFSLFRIVDRFFLPAENATLPTRQGRRSMSRAGKQF
jgi:hypothetical protein